MSYLSAGLMTGAGIGISKIGDEMWHEVHAEADELRKESFRKLGWEHDTTVRDEKRTYDKGILDDKNAREDRQKSKEIKSWRDIDGGKQVAVNVYGDDIVEKTRPISAAEAKDGTNGSDKFNAGQSKQARQILFDDTFKQYADDIKAKTGEDINMGEFIITMEDGTTKYNETAIKSKFGPELYDEWKTKSVLMEDAMKEGHMWPERAKLYADKEWESIQKKKEEKQTKAEEGKKAKTYGMSVSNYKAALGIADKKNAIELVAGLSNKDPQRFSILTSLYRKERPAFYRAIMETVPGKPTGESPGEPAQPNLTDQRNALWAKSKPPVQEVGLLDEPAP